MEDELVLQGEETLKTSQQIQDLVPHDPNAAARFPEGYTPVGGAVDNTPIEYAPVIGVDQVEVTAGIYLETPVEYYGSSSDDVFLRSNFPSQRGIDSEISLTPLKTSNGITNSLPSINSIIGDDIPSDESPIQKDVVEPPTEQPITPVAPTPEIPTTPVDPGTPDPPTPPVDPEDPEEPDPEEPEDPEEPDPEDPGKGNPGNDKEVGNSPWDGETGASDNPGKGNHQDGQDPEPNQPPGDSKNDGGKNNDSEDPPSNGGNGGKPENHQDNGWGNGDDDPPGNSGPHNNAENDASPSEYYDDLVGRFLEENSGRFPEENPIDVVYNWKQDNDSFLDYTPEFDPRFDHVPEIPHFDNFDLPIDHYDHSMYG